MFFALLGKKRLIRIFWSTWPRFLSMSFNYQGHCRLAARRSGVMAISSLEIQKRHAYIYSNYDGATWDKYANKGAVYITVTTERISWFLSAHNPRNNDYQGIIKTYPLYADFHYCQHRNYKKVIQTDQVFGSVIAGLPLFMDPLWRGLTVPKIPFLLSLIPTSLFFCCSIYQYPSAMNLYLLLSLLGLRTVWRWSHCIGHVRIPHGLRLFRKRHVGDIMKPFSCKTFSVISQFCNSFLFW